jgi:hypothetical protein
MGDFNDWNAKAHPMNKDENAASLSYLGLRRLRFREVFSQEGRGGHL